MVRLGMRHIVLAVSLLSLAVIAASALGAEVQTLPSQQVPEIRGTPPPITRQSGENLSIPPRLPLPQNNSREIPLPEIFRGCWSGTVSAVDSVQPLRAGMGGVMWLTKRYKLCYKQVGYNGNWQLTFAEGMVTDRRVSDQRQLIKIKSVRGPNEAELTAFLHFRTHPFVTFWSTGKGSTIVDELAQLHCEVIPGRDLMAVKAIVFVESNGEPNFDMTWHANFFRTG